MQAFFLHIHSKVRMGISVLSGVFRFYYANIYPALLPYFKHTSFVADSWDAVCQTAFLYLSVMIEKCFSERGDSGQFPLTLMFWHFTSYSCRKWGGDYGGLGVCCEYCFHALYVYYRSFGAYLGAESAEIVAY